MASEKDPVTYHGVTPFEVASGRMAPKKPGPPSYTRVFADTLCRLAREDERIVAITAAMAGGMELEKR